MLQNNKLLAKLTGGAKLSLEETREILTPFAFKIDESLFGISLAKPWKRAGALLIDLLCVAILSFVPGELLALLIAITLFRIGSKKRAAKLGKKPGKRRTMLRFTGGFIVFVMLLDNLPHVFEQIDMFNYKVEQAGRNQSFEDSKAKNIDSEYHLKSDLSSSTTVKVALNMTMPLAISQSECQNYSCWKVMAADIAVTYSEQTASEDEASAFVDEVIKNIGNNSELSQRELTNLNNYLNSEIKDKRKENALVKQVPDAKKLVENANEIDVPNVDDLIASEDLFDNKNQNSSVYKGFAWLKGFIDDLGIGFGWAAFYFTMATAIWHGQTIGKRLFGIRVLQLDGTPLSVWDSFGRYGGYGAGIATGLLGFAQIYWDPNRQAIHDKISATIVIDDKLSAKFLKTKTTMKIDNL